MNRSGIYAIRNTVNGKVYVGSAVCLRKRRDAHFANLKRGNHHSKKLQRAWNKYGSDSFSFKPLLICEKKDLIFYEQRAIDTFCLISTGYNVCPKAGSSLGLKQSRELVARRTAPLVGRKRSAETKIKMSRALTGRKFSDETRAKMSAVRIGVHRKPFSDEHRLNLSIARLGYKHSPETKAKISKGQLGRKMSPESIAKTAAANRGRKNSAQAIENMRRAKIGTKHSPETCEKLSEIVTAWWATRKSKGVEHVVI